MDSKAVVKPAIVLLLISAIAAGILGVVSEVTAAPIAAQNEKSLNEGMQAVMPDASSFELLDADLTGTITAVYCNDRSTSGSTSLDNTSFGARIRLQANKTPSYNCATIEDKFTVDKSTGNGKLTYPIGLMTADEVVFAGGQWFTDAKPWYYYNSANGISTGSEY